MLVYKKNSKLDASVSLFDVQSAIVPGKAKFDLTISPQGQVNRVIGADKLLQHSLKLTLLARGIYTDDISDAQNLGTSVSGKSSERSVNSIRREIIDSFKTYAKMQNDNASLVESDVMGWDIYRTRTPEVSSSWEKLNKHLVSNTFYYDSELLSTKTYFYGVVKVRNVNGVPTPDAVGTGLEITIPSTDTLNAVIGDDFIMIPTDKAVTLYWNRFVEYNDEELLDTLPALEVNVPLSEPRLLRIYFRIKNKERTALETSTTA